MNNTRKVVRKASWYYNGTGFKTKEEAMLWAACKIAVFRGKGSGADLVVVAQHFKGVMRELKRIQLANR